MGKKLYVGGLPFDTTESQLQTLFASYGEVVSAKLITDKFSGQSKGFGFVEFSEEAAAKEAVEKLNGSPVGTRKIIVAEARPMVKRDGGNWGKDKGGGRNSWGKRRDY